MLAVVGLQLDDSWKKSSVVSFYNARMLLESRDALPKIDWHIPEKASEKKHEKHSFYPFFHTVILDLINLNQNKTCLKLNSNLTGHSFQLDLNST